MKSVMPNIKHKHFSNILKILITLGLLIYAFSKFSLIESIAVIKSANYSWFGMALVLNIITVLLQGHKWHYINRYLGIDLPYMETQRLNWISNFYGFFTPGKLGGDAYRYISLSKGSSKNNKTVSLTSTIIEKLSTLYAVFTLGSLATIYVEQMYSDIDLNSVIYLFIISVLIILFIFIFYRSLASWINNVKFRNKWYEKFFGLLKLLFNQQNLRKTLFVVFIYSLIYQVISSLIVYVCSIALYMNISFFDILLVFSISTLVTALPISISGIGVRETIYITLLGALGQGSTISLSLSILVFLSGLFIITIGGIFSLKINK